MKTFATLGGVKFELPAINEMSQTRQWEYKEQETVAETAVLQFAGAKPRTMSLKAQLHAKFAPPEERLKELEAKAKKIAPLPFILANGTLLGYFVIEDLTDATTKTDEKGNVIAVNVDLKLKESKSGEGGAGAAAPAPPAPSSIKTTQRGVTQAPTLPSSNPVANIRATMQARQNEITGRVPSVEEAMRKMPLPIP